MVLSRSRTPVTGACLMMLWLTALSHSGAAADEHDSGPVARILYVQGSATIHEPETEKRREASLYDAVYEQERIHLASESLIVLLFRGQSHLERVRGAGTVTATPNGCRGDCKIDKVATGGEKAPLKRKGIRRLSGLTKGAAVVARGDSPHLTPIVGSTILDQTPLLSWPEVENAQEYRVGISSLDGRGRSWSGKSNKSEYQVPDGFRLERGIAYEWSVLARYDGNRIERVFYGTFQVGTVETLDAAAQIEALTSSDDEALVALAAWGYMQHELYGLALPAYERLLKVSQTPTQYHGPLAVLYKKAGRTADAEALSR